ncbi:hypothetical protein Aca07nite_88010 [Actinoplanes capillaceus]|uniref:Uncharacterized protein n=1 Tax=Actinoplanes campanulatus TaxID=113559 RepID=A0ABQ3WZ15_9ACTN|nr:DUF4352 domain-containing protein [Actinoplanes capillaceus]GID51526.1 hypothetical protein Aca07nite_88010 [Actinoplanes capillaceus]
MIALVVSGVVLFALFTAGIVAERASRDTAVTAVDPPAETETNKTKRPSGIGDPVRDGKFEFVVSHVDCSRAGVGIEHLRRTAQGRYCVVTQSVRNIADEPKYFLGLAQKAPPVLELTRSEP